MMHEWMGDQVIKACYEKMPPITYHDYIVMSLANIAPESHDDLVNIMEKGHHHTKDWLEKVATHSGSNEEKITPHQVYFKRIVKLNLQDRGHPHTKERLDKVAKFDDTNVGESDDQN